MKARDILNYLGIESNDEREIKKISFDNNYINKNVIYLSFNKLIKSIKKDVIVLTNRKQKNAIYIKDLKKKLTPLFLYFNNIKTEDFYFIVITGTSMKSSLAKLLYDYYLLQNENIGLISTSFRGKNIFKTRLTTPQGNELVEILKKAKKRGIKKIIFEASSIGIKEYRLEGIRADEIILTNLFEDHLDYHKNLKNYYNAKKSYILKANKIYATKENIKTLKIKKSFIPIEQYQIIDDKKSLVIKYENTIYSFKYFNKLTSLLLPYLLTYRNNHRLINISSLHYPKGRIQIIKKAPYLLLDYAHSEDAFYKVSSYFASVVKGKKIVVFGAGGEREKQKRIKYGEISLKFYDIAIISEDNPRNEDVMQIISDIVKVNPYFFYIVCDRKKAIDLAFKFLSSHDDGIAFLGKGSEKGINRSGKIYLYNEEEEIKKCYAQWILLNSS